jgi:predicted transcriptional regulator
MNQEMTTHEEFKKEQFLKDPATKAAYEEMEPEMAVIKKIIEKRNELELSQKELAERIGTHQSAVSRLESGTYNPSLEFLKKVSKALDSRLGVRLR